MEYPCRTRDQRLFDLRKEVNDKMEFGKANLDAYSSLTWLHITVHDVTYSEVGSKTLQEITGLNGGGVFPTLQQGQWSFKPLSSKATLYYRLVPSDEAWRMWSEHLYGCSCVLDRVLYTPTKSSQHLNKHLIHSVSALWVGQDAVSGERNGRQMTVPYYYVNEAQLKF